MGVIFKRVENIARKGANLVTSIFLFSHNVFKSGFFFFFWGGGNDEVKGRTISKPHTLHTFTVEKS